MALKDKPYTITNFLNSIGMISPDLLEFCLKELAQGYTVEEIKCRIEDAIKASGRV